MLMTLSECKAALGKRVHYRNDRLLINGTYILTAVIIRQSEQGKLIAQAELTSGKTVLIAALSDVQLLGVTIV